MPLRDYQSAAVETLWQRFFHSDKVLCTAPTGVGKSEIFIELLKRADVPSIVIIGRRNLVAQTHRRLLKAGLNATLFNAEIKHRHGNVVVASIQTAYKYQFQDRRLVIFDEAHNLKDGGMYESFLSAHPNAKVAGFTATPWRNDGLIYGEDKFFSQIDYSYSFSDAIASGWIVPPTMKAPPHAFDTSQLSVVGGEFKLSEVLSECEKVSKVKAQIEDAIPRLVGRYKVVWVCASIEHAEMVKRYLPETASILHSNLSESSQQLNMNAFERGAIRHMITVMMMSEGYDYPAIDAVVLMRPTKSSKLMVQIIGRGLRKFEGKESCTVLDYGEVVKHCGTLDNPVVREKGESTTRLEIMEKVCPNCYSICKKDALSCLDCSYEWEVEKREWEKNVKTTHSESVIYGVPKDRKLIVESVSFNQHKSKAGNECVRIDYNCTDQMWPVSEYFSEHPFSYGKLRARLLELGIPLVNINGFETIHETVEQLRPPKIPALIVVGRDGNFDKIKELIFEDNAELGSIGSADRTGDSALFEFP